MDIYEESFGPENVHQLTKPSLNILPHLLELVVRRRRFEWLQRPLDPAKYLLPRKCARPIVCQHQYDQLDERAGMNLKRNSRTVFVSLGIHRRRFQCFERQIDEAKSLRHYYVRPLLGDHPVRAIQSGPVFTQG